MLKFENVMKDYSSNLRNTIINISKYNKIDFETRNRDRGYERNIERERRKIRYREKRSVRMTNTFYLAIFKDTLLQIILYFPKIILQLIVNMKNIDHNVDRIRKTN